MNVERPFSKPSANENNSVENANYEEFLSINEQKWDVPHSKSLTTGGKKKNQND